MNWTIFRTKRFGEALDDYTAQVSGSRQSVGDDRSAQAFLRANKELRVFYEALMSFEDLKVDPEKVLPQAWNNGAPIKNIHFLRSGSYYAFYERDPVTRSATGNLVFKRYDYLRWIKEVLAMNMNLFL